MKAVLLFFFVSSSLVGLSQPNIPFNLLNYQQFGKSVVASGKRPLDAKYKYYDPANFVTRAYKDTTEVRLVLPLNQRDLGQKVLVNTGGTLLNGVITGGTNADWWYKDGTTDASLVPFVSGGGGGGISPINTTNKYLTGYLTWGNLLDSTLYNWNGVIANPSSIPSNVAGAVITKQRFDSLNFWGSNSAGKIYSKVAQVGIGVTSPANGVAVDIAGGEIHSAGNGLFNGVYIGSVGDITNTSLGNAVLLYNTSGTYNTGAGISTLSALTTGSNNTGVGAQSMVGLLTGSGNTGVGKRSLYGCTTCGENTAIGKDALFDVTTGSYNVGIGSTSGSGILTGSNNTIIGSRQTGFPSYKSGIISISDGAGNKRIYVDSLGNLTLPAYATGGTADTATAADSSGAMIALISRATGKLLPSSTLYTSTKFATVGTVQTHTSGSTVTVGAGVKTLRINPNATLASLTITMAAGAVDNDQLIVVFGGTINTPGTVIVTSLNFVANTGQTMLHIAAAGAMTKDDKQILNLASSIWY